MPTHYPEKAERARELYAKGYTIRQIATRINTQYATAKRYVDPEYDELARQRGIERKKRYEGTCEICGEPTSYSGKKTLASRRCQKHANVGRKRWTQEAVIEAIQRWTEIHGHPPTSVDWNAAVSKIERGPEYPSTTSVYGQHGAFPRWADAIEAAGFPRPKTTYVGKFKEATWTKERILDLLREQSVDGVAPTSTSWAKRASGRPTSTWVTRLFGSWSNACHEAGLQTFQERYWHGRESVQFIPSETVIAEKPGRKRKKKSEPIQDRSEEQLALVHRLMNDYVLRRYIVHRLWQLWGFSSPKQFARWLSENGIEEFVGHRFQPRRQFTRAEFLEAQELAPAGGTKAKK